MRIREFRVALSIDGRGKRRESRARSSRVRELPIEKTSRCPDPCCSLIPHHAVDLQSARDRVIRSVERSAAVIDDIECQDTRRG